MNLQVRRSGIKVYESLATIWITGPGRACTEISPSSEITAEKLHADIKRKYTKYLILILQMI